MSRTSTVLARELQVVGTTLRDLSNTFSRLAPRLASVVAEAEEKSRTIQGGRRRPRLSAKQRAALKLQGKYMGTMRGLPATKRALVKKIRVEKGIKAAIAAAERLAS